MANQTRRRPDPIFTSWADMKSVVPSLPGKRLWQLYPKQKTGDDNAIVMHAGYDGSLVLAAGSINYAALPAIRSGIVVSVDTQLAADGDMEAADVSAWVVISSATLTKQTTTPKRGTRCIRVAYNGTANPGASQAILTVGQTYRAVVWARGDGTAVPRLYHDGASLVSGVATATWQRLSMEFVASTTNIRLYAITSGASYCEFDDLHVHDVSTGSTQATLETGHTLITGLTGRVCGTFVGAERADKALTVAGDAVSYSSLVNVTPGDQIFAVDDMSPFTVGMTAGRDLLLSSGAFALFDGAGFLLRGGGLQHTVVSGSGKVCSVAAVHSGDVDITGLDATGTTNDHAGIGLIDSAGVGTAGPQRDATRWQFGAAFGPLGTPSGWATSGYGSAISTSTGDYAASLSRTANVSANNWSLGLIGKEGLTAGAATWIGYGITTAPTRTITGLAWRAISFDRQASIRVRSAHLLMR